MLQPLIPGLEESFDADLSQKRVMVSLSGGINSAAVLCYLASEYHEQYRPTEIFLFYSHLREHSPDTFKFVKALIRYAQVKFECVTWEIKRGSVNALFKKERMIPHPVISPCSERLKQIPAQEFIEKHSIDVDLIGYVREEKRRVKRQQEKNIQGKIYPIFHYSDEDCFVLVRREIGWYPAIYDIRENGKRVFLHNNCLPCKNFQGHLLEDGEHTGDYSKVKKYYPEYFERARQVAKITGAYWGRPEDPIEDEFQGFCLFCEETS